MFVAILERKDHGSNVKYKATLRVAAETGVLIVKNGDGRIFFIPRREALKNMRQQIERLPLRIRRANRF